MSLKIMPWTKRQRSSPGLPPAILPGRPNPGSMNACWEGAPEWQVTSRGRVQPLQHACSSSPTQGEDWRGGDGGTEAGKWFWGTLQ